MSSGPGAGGGGGGQTVDLTTLSTAQLSQVKKQLDTELEHLTNSFGSLRGAQSKFRDCIKSLGSLPSQAAADAQPHNHLIPLTPSLYVPGRFASTEHVLVDVGTGFFVEKNIDDAKEFYNAKVKELETNLKDLEGIVQGKSQNLRLIEDVLRQKVLASNSTPQEAAAS